MKEYLIVDTIPIKNTLVLRDPDDGSLQYYKLHSQDTVANYVVGTKLEV